jgi:hypothetical protein
MPYLEAFEPFKSQSDHLSEMFCNTHCDESLFHKFLDAIEPGSQYFYQGLMVNMHFADIMVSQI